MKNSRVSWLWAAVLAWLVTSCATPRQDDYRLYHRTTILTPTTPLSVELIPAQGIDVRGIYDANDGIGPAGGVLYSGNAGAGGLLAQVLLHAAVSNNAQDSKLKKQQEQADLVLTPFLREIIAISAADLMHPDARYQFNPNKTVTEDLIIKSRPIFYLSQDERRLSIIHVVEALTTADTKAEIIYGNVIEILGPILPAETARQELLSDGPLGIDTQIKNLYQQAMDLTMRDLYGEWNSASATEESHRISRDQTVRYERGTLLQSSCSRQIIRNLRGWIIAYPPAGEQLDCLTGI